MEVVTSTCRTLGVEAKGGCVVTTEAMRVHLFCLVDDRLGAQHKVPLARLSPSAVVTIGVLFALKGVSFRAFERCLNRCLAGWPSYQSWECCP